MGVEEKYLAQFKVGKWEEYAARMAFFMAGFAMATWAPMIPVIKDELNIGADILGMLLLCIGVSAFIVMPIAGMLGHKFGCKKVMIVSLIGMILSLIAIAMLNNIWGIVVFLLVLGSSMGCVDVNMNINAVVVEKIAQRRMMSGMHAFWSIGCFCSAGLFTILAKLGLAMLTIVILHSVIVLIMLLIFSPHFLFYKGSNEGKAIELPRGIVILFGILACITFLAEGAAMDWSGVFLTEVKSIEISMAGIGYAIFSVAMLVMRLIGDKVVQFLGEQKAVILGSLVAGIGFLLIVFIDDMMFMPIGFILLGLGAANIVPVLYSLLKYQSDMPLNAAVTAITCLGYAGVILGPALLGFIAHSASVTFVFYLLAALLILQSLIAKYIFKKIQN